MDDFDALDANRDGVIDRSEWARRYDGPPAMQPKTPSAVLASHGRSVRVYPTPPREEYGDAVRLLLDSRYCDEEQPEEQTSYPMVMRGESDSKSSMRGEGEPKGNQMHARKQNEAPKEAFGMSAAEGHRPYGQSPGEDSFGDGSIEVSKNRYSAEKRDGSIEVSDGSVKEVAKEEDAMLMVDPPSVVDNSMHADVHSNPRVMEPRHPATSSDIDSKNMREKEATEPSSEIDSVQQKHTQFASRVGSIPSALSAELGALRDSYTELEASHRDLQKQHQELQGSHETIQSEHACLLENHQEVLQSHQEVIQTAEAAHRESVNQKDSHLATRNELEETKRAHQLAKSKRAKEKQEAELSQTQLAAVKMELEACKSLTERQRGDLEENAKKAKEDRAAYRKELGVKKESLLTNRTLLAKQKEESEACRTQLQTATEKLAACESKLGKTMSERDSSRRDLGSLLEEVEASKVTLTKEREVSAALKTRLASVDDELAASKARLRKEQDDSSRLGAELQKLIEVP